ncbi:hypothetical protein [Roseococcus sp.]|uniref:hypothetical protein n=1 Tax=Roseococcus sp. TaxID=2109646 RepID=UPI003BA9682F
MSRRATKVVRLEVHVRVPMGFPTRAVIKDVRSRVSNEVGFYDTFPDSNGDIIDLYKAVKAVKVKSLKGSSP